MKRLVNEQLRIRDRAFRKAIREAREMMANGLTVRITEAPHDFRVYGKKAVQK